MPLALSTQTVLIVMTVWAIGGFLFALVIGKVMAKGQPPEHPTFSLDHPDRPRLGLIEEDAAERQERVDRALRRHGDRRGRAA